MPSVWIVNSDAVLHFLFEKVPSPSPEVAAGLRLRIWCNSIGKIALMTIFFDTAVVTDWGHISSSLLGAHSHRSLSIHQIFQIGDTDFPIFASSRAQNQALGHAGSFGAVDER